MHRRRRPPHAINLTFFFFFSFLSAATIKNTRSTSFVSRLVQATQSSSR